MPPKIDAIGAEKGVYEVGSRPQNNRFLSPHVKNRQDAGPQMVQYVSPMPGRTPHSAIERESAPSWKTSEQFELKNGAGSRLTSPERPSRAREKIPKAQSAPRWVNEGGEWIREAYIKRRSQEKMENFDPSRELMSELVDQTPTRPVLREMKLEDNRADVFDRVQQGPTRSTEHKRPSNSRIDEELLKEEARLKAMLEVTQRRMRQLGVQSTQQNNQQTPHPRYTSPQRGNDAGGMPVGASGVSPNVADPGLSPFLNQSGHPSWGSNNSTVVTSKKACDGTPDVTRVQNIVKAATQHLDSALNFDDWRTQLKGIVSDHKYDEALIDSSLPMWVADVEEPNESLEARKKRLELFQIMERTVDKKHKAKVEAVKREHHGNVRKLWEVLSQFFNSEQAHESISVLRKNLNACTMLETGKDCAEYALEYIRREAKLRALGINTDYKENFTNLLGGYSESFNPIKREIRRVLKATPTDPRLENLSTISQWVNEWAAAEGKHRLKVKTARQYNQELKLKNPTPTMDKRRNIACKFGEQCNNPVCPFKHSSSRKESLTQEAKANAGGQGQTVEAAATETKGRTKPRFKGKCNNCGITGHKRADCRKPKKRAGNVALSAHMSVSQIIDDGEEQIEIVGQFVSVPEGEIPERDYSPLTIVFDEEDSGDEGDVSEGEETQEPEEPPVWDPEWVSSKEYWQWVEDARKHEEGEEHPLPDMQAHRHHDSVPEEEDENVPMPELWSSSGSETEAVQEDDPDMPDLMSNDSSDSDEVEEELVEVNGVSDEDSMPEMVESSSSSEEESSEEEGVVSRQPQYQRPLQQVLSEMSRKIRIDRCTRSKMAKEVVKQAYLKENHTLEEARMKVRGWKKWFYTKNLPMLKLMQYRRCEAARQYSRKLSDQRKDVCTFIIRQGLTEATNLNAGYEEPHQQKTILDTGAMMHSFNPDDPDVRIQPGSYKDVNIKLVGVIPSKYQMVSKTATWLVPCMIDGQYTGKNVELKDSLVVKGSKTNLIAVGRLMDKGATIECKEQGATVSVKGMKLFDSKMENQLLEVNIKRTKEAGVRPESEANPAHILNYDNSVLIKRHNALGHRGFDAVRKLCNMPPASREDPNPACQPCLEAMCQDKKHPTDALSAAPRYGYRICVDSSRKMPAANGEGETGLQRYFVEVDEATNTIKVSFGQRKSDATRTLLKRIDEINAAISPLKVAEVQSDGGKEYDNKELKQELSKTGIAHRMSSPHCQYQNTIAEGAMKYIDHTSKAMMYMQR